MAVLRGGGGGGGEESAPMSAILTTFSSLDIYFHMHNGNQTSYDLLRNLLTVKPKLKPAIGVD